MTSSAAIIGMISDLVTGSVTWMTTIITFIVSQPLVLFFVLIPFVGIGIGLIKRLIA